MKAVFTVLLLLGLAVGSAEAQGRGHGRGNNEKAAGTIIAGPVSSTETVVVTRPAVKLHGVANARAHGGVAHAYGHRKQRRTTAYIYRTR